jgi:hypothetical protein
MKTLISIYSATIVAASYITGAERDVLLTNDREEKYLYISLNTPSHVPESP